MAARSTLADAFNSRNNALNALRLLFALLVIVGHAGRLGFGVDGFGKPGVRVLGFAPSELAVDGFFVISGYLICRSRVQAGKGGGPSYLWKRFLRIVPGYAICLLVTAFVVGPIAWSHEYGSLHGFLSLRGDGPVTFVLRSITFLFRQSRIAGVFAGSYAPGQVNGSLWTLPFEVIAYTGIAVLACLRLLRHRTWLGPSLAVCMLVMLVFCDVNAARLGTGVLDDGSRLGFFFAIGMSFYLWQDRIPICRSLALAAGAVWLASPWIIGSSLGKDWQLLGGVPFAYLTLWLGVRLPLSWVGRKRDLSYGTYLYAWPIQQLLTMWGVPAHGWVLYSLLAIGASLLVALVSWHLVEAPMLRFKGLVASPVRTKSDPATTALVANVQGQPNVERQPVAMPIHELPIKTKV